MRKSSNDKHILASGSRRVGVACIVTLGGVAALSWETVWNIRASLSFGVSAFGSALTLAATMGGMAAGSLAAGSWLRAKRRNRALAALKSAIGIAPKNMQLRSDRGLILALSGKLFAAVDDFNKVIEAEPKNTNVLVLRAATYRRLKSIALARDDLKRALLIDPDHPDALLERGILRLASKDRKGARADWIRIIQVAPKSAAATVARAKLAKFNLKKN